ncbi:hypothetical protein N665_0060s0002 [Sinapis alba]|nr:hypothetical protein N665_0060s0002 [Sinapis alba]
MRGSPQDLTISLFNPVLNASSDKREQLIYIKLQLLLTEDLPLDSEAFSPPRQHSDSFDPGLTKRIRITFEEEEIARKMKLVGLWCVQYSPSDRPPMNRVVEMMEGSLDALEIPPRPVFQTPTAPLPESSTVSEDISVYTEVCSMNIT